MTPVIIIIGAIFLLFGGYFRKTSVFLIVLVTVVFAVLVILYAFILSYSTPEWTGWIILAGAIVIGAIAA